MTHRLHRRVSDPLPPAVEPTSSEAARPGPTAPRRRLQSADLLGRATEIEIQHGEALYRLRLTSQGKLILTK